MKTKALLFAMMLVFSTASFAQFKIPKNPMGAMMGEEEEEQQENPQITTARDPGCPPGKK